MPNYPLSPHTPLLGTKVRRNDMIISAGLSFHGKLGLAWNHLADLFPQLHSTLSLWFWPWLDNEPLRHTIYTAANFIGLIWGYGFEGAIRGAGEGTFVICEWQALTMWTKWYWPLLGAHAINTHLKCSRSHNLKLPTGNARVEQADITEVCVLTFTLLSWHNGATC